MHHVRPALIATALATACGTGLVCTEIGCQGSLVVAIAGVVDDATVTIGLDGAEGATCVVPPTGEAACTGELGATVAVTSTGIEVVFPTGMTDGAPWTTADVVVRDAGGNLLLDEAALPLAWSAPLYPNGEQCDAPNGCRSATLDLAADL